MMKKFYQRLKKKWGIQNFRDFFLIMLVFSLAGMSITVLRPLIFRLLGITPAMPFWFKTLVYIPLIIPLYQISLLVFGLLCGQFSFFWEKEKKLFQALRHLTGRIFCFNNQRPL
jgi:hypothetical protein